jgi:hypothetical protein
MKSILLIFEDNEFERMKRVKEQLERVNDRKTTWKKLILMKMK